MRRLYTFLCLAVTGLIYCGPVAAQDLSARAAAAEFLRPELTDRIVLADTLLDFRTILRSNARIDMGNGIVRAEYDIKAHLEPSLNADEAALLYLEQSAAKFGFASPRDELLLTHVRRGYRSTHIRFQQKYRGIPVYNREIKVNLDTEGRPTMVVNGFAPHVSRDTQLRTTPSISQNDAASRAASAGRAELMTTTPDLVVYPSKPARLAWMLMAWPEDGTVEWEVLVDAHSGEIIQMLDLSPHAHRPVVEYEGVTARSGPLPSGSLPAGPLPARPASTPAVVANVDGTGMVFDPDPITSAGVAYGDAYVDAQDSDVPELNSERRPVLLRDISQGADGLYRLIGPYVAIDGATRGDAYSPPAEASPDGFQYTRSNDYFEAVMAYYHVDTSQRYIQSLDVGFDVLNEPMLVNPHAYQSDYSDFSPSNNILLFGTGGIDDAEDADVILHEYAHALLYDIEPGLLRSFEGKALHEGWGDYWAASYSRFLSDEDPSIPPNDWWRVFTWDGNVPCWPGRPLDHPGSYPDDTAYPASGCTSYDQPYDSGMLWATTLMEIYPHVGRTVLDRLNLASHAYLASSATLPDGAHAIIQADRDLYGGAHVDVLVERFGERGFVDPTGSGPAAQMVIVPEKLDFPSILALERDTLIVRVSNTGTADLNISSVRTTADPFDARYVPVTAPGDSTQILVTFDPLLAGTYVDTLRIYSNAVNGRVDIPLSAHASSPLALPVIPEAPYLDFGNVLIGESASAVAEIINVGRYVASITNATTSHPEFAAANEAADVPPDGSYQLEIVFTPSEKGVFLDTLEVSTNVTADPLLLALRADVTTGVATGGDSEIPAEFALHQNFPNPFNPTTQITFDVPTTAHVTITVVDLLGRVIDTLVDGEETPGTHSVTLDMTTRPSAVYFYRMQAGSFSSVQRLVLAK